ncbi:CopG family transcriptional regulator [Salibacteraceae bacterium]|nr:CopG family transcriptional regulator [Salibacteraceae bacterium]
MSTFTSTLPGELLAQLAETANKLSLPKNKLIEKALRIYLNQLTRVEYINSYKQMNDDVNIMDMAEEGMVDYLKQTEL